MIDHLMTNDTEKLQATLSEMTGGPEHSALSLNNLTDAMIMLPFDTWLVFDKRFGRWMFSNEDRDDWPDPTFNNDRVSGPNFTFVDNNPEMVIARAIYYYYHLKIKE